MASDIPPAKRILSDGPLTRPIGIQFPPADELLNNIHQLPVNFQEYLLRFIKHVVHTIPSVPVNVWKTIDRFMGIHMESRDTTFSHGNAKNDDRIFTHQAKFRLVCRTLQYGLTPLIDIVPRNNTYLVYWITRFLSRLDRTFPSQPISNMKNVYGIINHRSGQFSVNFFSWVSTYGISISSIRRSRYIILATGDDCKPLVTICRSTGLVRNATAKGPVCFVWDPAPERYFVLSPQPPSVIVRKPLPRKNEEMRQLEQAAISAKLTSADLCVPALTPHYHSDVSLPKLF